MYVMLRFAAYSPCSRAVYLANDLITHKAHNAPEPVPPYNSHEARQWCSRYVLVTLSENFVAVETRIVRNNVQIRASLQLQHHGKLYLGLFICQTRGVVRSCLPPLSL